jgi:hypothetical protein
MFLGFILFILFYKDEKKHTFKKYYPDSQETYLHEYIIRNGDTLLHGKFMVYNKIGCKVAEGNIINNVPKGKFIYYYGNGKIESIKYVIDKKRNAEYHWYYPNGKIKKYAFFSNYEEPIFLISYDEKGPIKYEGPTLDRIYQGKINSKKQPNVKNDTHFKVGDTILHQYLIANIPQAKRSFKVVNIGIDNTQVKRKITSKPPTTIDVTEVLTTKGKNTIRAVVKYEFEDKVIPAINDTLTFDVQVN